MLFIVDTRRLYVFAFLSFSRLRTIFSNLLRRKIRAKLFVEFDVDEDLYRDNNSVFVESRKINKVINRLRETRELSQNIKCL